MKITFRYLTDIFSFSRNESVAVVLLLIIFLAAAFIFKFCSRKGVELSEFSLHDGSVHDVIVPHISHGEVGVRDSMFYFDPNTVTFLELHRLGLTANEAAGVIKYRERGKVFQIPEDLATCYSLPLEKYLLLEPYIVIGDGYKVSKFSKGGERVSTKADSGPGSMAGTLTGPFDPNAADTAEFINAGFSRAQAGVLVKYRSMKGGFKDIDDFASCYVVSDEMVEVLRPFLIFEKENTTEDIVGSAVVFPVELNSADSATLRKIVGVGEVLAARIVDYRKRLGGYANIRQLAEIPGMYESNYERIIQQIFIDSCKIHKIDINFADQKSLKHLLSDHPYAGDKLLRKILKNRQLKGGWSSIEDMVNDNTLNDEQARRLAPYLIFL